MKFNENITDQILEEFKLFSKYPRPSGHEEAAANYLADLGNSLGLKTIKDDVNNIIIEKPASQGYENAPTTILQGHIDMVVAVADGADFDPLTDTVKLVKQGNTLTAENTSLGADNGIGIAMAIKILKDKTLKHGPIRAIFTTDEETSGNGSKNIDPKYFNAGYLINIDFENVNEICIGSTESTKVTYDLNITKTNPKLSKAFKIKLSGLSGGHSGFSIGLGQANSIKVMTDILNQLSSNINIELSEFNGGSSFNAIPETATSVIVIDQNDEPKLKEIIEKATEFNTYFYKKTEPNIRIELKEQEMPKTVLTDDSKKSLIGLLNILPNDTMFKDHCCDGNIDSSTNLGIVETLDSSINIISYYRSALNELSFMWVNIYNSIGELFGIKPLYSTVTLLWEPKQNSKLTNKMLEIYKNQGISDAYATTVHAGTECAQFLVYNPELDAVSIGPTISDPHSIHESLTIDTIAPIYKSIINVLEELR